MLPSPRAPHRPCALRQWGPRGGCCSNHGGGNDGGGPCADSAESQPAPRAPRAPRLRSAQRLGRAGKGAAEPDHDRPQGEPGTAADALLDFEDLLADCLGEQVGPRDPSTRTFATAQRRHPRHAARGAARAGSTDPQLAALAAERDRLQQRIKELSSKASGQGQGGLANARAERLPETPAEEPAEVTRPNPGPGPDPPRDVVAGAQAKKSPTEQAGGGTLWARGRPAVCRKATKSSAAAPGSEPAVATPASDGPRATVPEQTQQGSKRAPTSDRSSTQKPTAPKDGAHPPPSAQATQAAQAAQATQAGERTGVAQTTAVPRSTGMATEPPVPAPKAAKTVAALNAAFLRNVSELVRVLKKSRDFIRVDIFLDFAHHTRAPCGPSTRAKSQTKSS